MNFKANDRVMVVRTLSKPHTNEETFRNEDYPQIGWTGTLCDEHLADSWVIEWDSYVMEDWEMELDPESLGDLIREWMIIKIEETQYDRLKRLGMI